MSLFRKDPFGPAWVLISPERGLEASDFGSVPRPSGPSSLSPNADPSLRELAARRPTSSGRDGPDWRIRAVQHPGALLADRPFEPCRDGPFQHAPSHGFQEIVVEHPDARLSLDTFPLDHLVEVLRFYRERMEFLASRPHVRHVQLTRNVGRAAGALHAHAHGQLLAAPVPSRWVQEEVAESQAHHAQSGRCLFCEVLDAERRQRERVITSNARYVAIAPYASKTPFEAWIVPRRHGSAFAHEPVNDLRLLAELLQGLVRAMNGALDRPPYNLLLHTMPHAGVAYYHWHAKVLPRLTNHSGFDWGNGFYVNPTPPEDAARFLRESLAMQEVT